MSQCQRCGTKTTWGRAHCDDCWRVVTEEGSVGESPSAQIRASSPDTTRQAGGVVGVIGILLLVFGAIRWNSLASQIARGFGGSDGVGLLLLLAGAAAVAIGSWHYFDASSARGNLPSAVSRSAEDRIRQLDDLRSKHLITDAEFEQRKKDIIASL